VVIENLRVPVAVRAVVDCLNDLHHDLPGIDGEVGIVERPIELFLGNRLVCGIVIWSEIWMSKSFGGCDALLWCKHQHAFQHINGCNVSFAVMRENYEPVLSMVLNRWLSGCLSRLGRD
jgi:hypothetical protein